MIKQRKCLNKVLIAECDDICEELLGYIFYDILSKPQLEDQIRHLHYLKCVIFEEIQNEET